jgi:hypothetical protein
VLLSRAIVGTELDAIIASERHASARQTARLPARKREEYAAKGFEERTFEVVVW